MPQFPDDFLWGTATAAYQIEGAHEEDGRGESIWDRFSHTPGNVTAGDTGDIACDHYHRYPEDLQLLTDLGVGSYRFSISWPRVYPEKGHFNPAGLDFYKRLLAGLRERNIVPAVTLYHWDLPQWCQDEGGWMNRDTVQHFVDFAETVFRELGPSVPFWITHNEPFCSAFLGHGIGVHAPGHRDWHEAVVASHHIFLSHGLAVQRYRALGLSGQIGITLNLSVAYPASSDAADVAAAKRSDGFSNRWFLDPLFRGSYPADMLELFEQCSGPIQCILPGDLDAISTPIDFLGVNYYSTHVVKDGAQDKLLRVDYVPRDVQRTDMGWEIHPEGLFDLLQRIAREYTKLPLYITENGAAFPDVVVDGVVADTGRIDYLRTHFDAARRFIEEGGNLRGYYVWSLMDNFEWAFGYSKRFGIVFVDYETQQRIPKESFKWFQQVIAQKIPV